MIENTTEASRNSCEQKIDDVDEVDSHGNIEQSAVALAIDFSADTKIAIDNEKPKNKTIENNEKMNDVDNFQNEEQNELVILRNENALLKDALAKINVQYMQLQTVFAQKESMIELQQKELTLLENEKASVKRDFEVARKEKETAVVRYATIEKTIIDLTTAKDLALKKLKDATKETEQLQNRIKTVCSERDKSQKQHRDSIRECESLKTELQMYESKNKYSEVKIRQEIANKNTLDIKLTEMTQQFNKLNEERQHQIDSDRRSEQEQGAQVILYKHMLEAKDKEINGLQSKLVQLTTEFNDISDKYNVLSVDCEYEKIEKQRYQDKVDELEHNIQEVTRRYEQLELKLTESERSNEMLNAENEHIKSALNEFKETEEEYHDQKEEMAQVRAKEDELLGLMKDMTEKCVIVENQLILSTSKASALQLENDKIKHEFEVQRQKAKELEDQFMQLKQKRCKEATVFGRILTEQKSKCDKVATELEDTLGELNTQKRKHMQVVKELNRELTELRSSNESSPKSCRSLRDIPSESVNSLDASINSPCNGSAGENGAHEDIVDAGTSQEPSTKALIARIARLQAVLAKQMEKIEFLENHCIALTNKLRAKSS